MNLTVTYGKPAKHSPTQLDPSQTNRQPDDVAAVYQYLAEVFNGAPCHVSLAEGVIDFDYDGSQFCKDDPIIYTNVIPSLQEFEGLVLCVLDVADKLNWECLGFTPVTSQMRVSFVLRRGWVRHFRNLSSVVRSAGQLMLTALHEVLHAVGLKHCSDSLCVMRCAFDNGGAIPTDLPPRDIRQLLCANHLRELQEHRDFWPNS